MVTISARGAIGRRSTFRPCRSGFESPRADHPAAQRECARVANRGLCKTARNPAWRNWLTRPPQDRLNAAGLKPASMWVRLPPPGPITLRGHSRRGRRRVVSAGVRVRVPLSSPIWARRSTGGFAACTREMRVRFPPGPPWGHLLTARHSGPHPESAGSTPAGPTNLCCGREGRRPQESHKLHHAGSIPASATTLAGSSKGKAPVLQTGDGGSSPSPATNSRW